MDTTSEVDQWYRQYGPDVVKQVRRMLWESTKTRVGMSSSDIGQSIWESFIRGVEQKGVNVADPNCVWGILVKAARRHTDRYNKRGQRQQQKLLADEREETLADHREPPTESRLVYDECLELLRQLNPSAIKEPPRPRRDSDLAIVNALTPLQRELLGLKIAGLKMSEIVNRLSIEHKTVYDDTHLVDLWKEICQHINTTGQPGRGLAGRIAELDGDPKPPTSS